MVKYCDREVVTKLGLAEVVPVPKGTTTLKSFVEPGKTARLSNGDNQFYETIRDPTNAEVKKLIGIMLSNTIDMVMSNHFYTIGGNIRQQEEGGSIGSDATGELSRIFMLLWDATLVQKC